MDAFTRDLEKCMAVLASERLAGIATQAGRMLAADATSYTAVRALLKHSNAAPAVILLADGRDLLQHVSALDLAVFDWMEERPKPLAVLFEGVLGVAEELLAEDGSAPIALSTDEFSFALIKRLRRPLAVLPACANDLQHSVAIVAGTYTSIITDGYAIEKFV